MELLQDETNTGTNKFKLLLQNENRSKYLRRDKLNCNRCNQTPQQLILQSANVGTCKLTSEKVKNCNQNEEYSSTN
jgi:hypothetical protein